MKQDDVVLRFYQRSDFPWLNSWVTSAELLFQFAGTNFTYPFTEAQLMEYQQEHPDRRFYTGTSAGQRVAFGEIIPQENGSPRLGRILVGNPEARGKGIGQQFISALVDESVRLLGCRLVELNVWDENISAIRCYEKVGFVFDPEAKVVLEAFGRSFNIHKMRLHVQH